MRDFNFLMTTRIVFNNDLAKGIQDAREFLGVKKAVYHDRSRSSSPANHEGIERCHGCHRFPV